MKQIYITEKNFEKARKAIRKAEGSVVFSSDNDELNRKILEKEKIKVFMPKLKGRKDKPKQRDSGFNHVLAKIAKKKNIIIGINLEEVLKSGKEEKAQILARIRQNIRICKKNKLKMEFLPKNIKNLKNLQALGLSLGMSTQMTKKL
jgi:ribonuclease P/MRP protein subunit RPP1